MIHCSRLWSEVATHRTNLNFSIVVPLGNDKWGVVVSNDKIRATSYKEYDVPTLGTPDYERDREIEHILNKIVGHLRNIFYFSFDLTMQWGYIGGYDGMQLNNSDGFFPSIHNNGNSSTSATYSPKVIIKNLEILGDIKSSRKKGLKTMLNYWRRAKELDDLGFNSEAFLNYFKIVECLAQLNQNDIVADAIKKRFVTQKTVLKRYKFRTDKQLRSDISFVAKALATSNIDGQIKRGLFYKVLDIVYMRHGWNIAHKLLRPSPYDTYDAVGQHSDEFRLVMIENIYVEAITKYLIINYVKPYKYRLGSNLAIEKI